MQKKKLLTTLIITLLTLSIIAAFIPMASAITITTPAAGSDHQVGDKVLVSGSAASVGGLVEVFWENTASENKLNETYADGAGDYECYIKIREDTAGSHYIIVRDFSTGETVSRSINIIPKIELTPDRGPTGTVVAITGRGFTEVADLDVTITVGGVTAPQVAPIKTKADGTFTGQFIVPTLSVAVHTVIASDGTISGTESFNVTETTTITLDPPAGMPAWEVTIEGLYFTAIADTPVTVKLAALTVKTLYTNATGGFTGTFVVPSLPLDEYIVNAADANNLYATANFTIHLALIVLEPTEGPIGTNVTITGYGFTKNDNVNVTIDTKLLLENIGTDAGGGFTDTFIVPALPVGTYAVKAVDSNGLYDTTSFALVPKLTATVDINPDTLNLKSKGKWITCYVELPEGHDVNDINVTTVMLSDAIPAEMHPVDIGDHDSDGIPDLMVKFGRAEVVSYILANVNMTKLVEERFMTITLTVTGYLNDGTPFQGSDTIRIIMPMPMPMRVRSWRFLETLEFPMPI